MFIPVFAPNKGSSLYQEAEFATHFSGTSLDRPLQWEPPSRAGTGVDKVFSSSGATFFLPHPLNIQFTPMWWFLQFSLSFPVSGALCFCTLSTPVGRSAPCPTPAPPPAKKVLGTSVLLSKWFQCVAAPRSWCRLMFCTSHLPPHDFSEIL